MDTPSVPLAQLPIEMLLRITRHLSTTDLCSVRLTSRSIERALFHSFSHEFFRRKQFMLTDFSLQALMDISQHPALSRTLRHVSIGLDMFIENLIQNYATEEQAIQFQVVVGQQMSLLNTGRAVDMLATAFASLPNLETIDLRDFDSHTRYRDGPGQPWRSYGYRRLVEQLGDDRGFLRHDATFASRGFLLLLAALAKANVRPRNLEVMMRMRNFGLSGRAFDLTVAPGADPAPLLAVVSGLQRLHVDVDFHQSPGYNTTYTPGSRSLFQPASVAGLPFHAFLAHAVNVEWLRLNLQNAKVRRTDIFLSYLGKPLPASYPFVTSPSSPSSASPAVTLPPRLRRLDLGHAEMSIPELLGLLRRIPLLGSLSLWNITLVDPANTTNPPAVWNFFLKILAAEPLAAQLHDISIGNARQLATINTSYSDPVVFDGSSSSKHTAGPTEPMPVYLGTLATIAKAQIPQVDDDDEDGEDDEDEDDGDDDDDDDDDDDNDDNDDNDNDAGDADPDAMT